MENESLKYIRNNPERIKAIKAEYKQRKIWQANQFKKDQTLFNLWANEDINQRIKISKKIFRKIKSNNKEYKMNNDVLAAIQKFHRRHQKGAS